MASELKAERIHQIEVSLRDLSELLESVAADQEWQPAPEEWSFREIAAHMKTVEQECHQDRVIRISAGEKSHYEYYYNTGRDFGGMSLMDNLQVWAETRQEIIGTVQGLSDEQLALTGTHARFGVVTVLDILNEMYKHDDEHIQDLKSVLETQYNKTFAAPQAGEFGE
ncbi:MAG: DinB family protein [Chloroflexota bacterium]